MNLLMMFKEIISVYSENHVKPLSRICGQNPELQNFKLSGVCMLLLWFKVLMKNGVEYNYKYQLLI
jgi:hypothetical protein